jgi:hypothetical protein
VHQRPGKYTRQAVRVKEQDQSAHPPVMAQSTWGVGIATSGTRVRCVAQPVPYRDRRCGFDSREDPPASVSGAGISAWGMEGRFGKLRSVCQRWSLDSAVSLPQLLLQADTRPLHL